jgi:hypothetical protein
VTLAAARRGLFADAACGTGRIATLVTLNVMTPRRMAWITEFTLWPCWSAGLERT